MYNEVAYLCKQQETQDAYGNIKETLTKREVFVQVRSIGRSEFYSAAVASLRPAVTLVLADAYDYDGERMVEYKEQLYDVIRHYASGHQMELVLEERVKNAGS